MNLAGLIEMLIMGWEERISYAERIKECRDGEHLTAALRLSREQLRHYQCECPDRIEKAERAVRQLPLITQMLQLKWAIPAIANEGPGSPNPSESKLPGNLVRPTELIGRLEIAAGIIISDWEIEVEGDVAVQLDRIDLRGPFKSESEREDAAHVLRVVVDEFLIELGYRERRVQFAGMVCDVCSGALSAARKDPTDVRCDGTPEKPSCGRLWGPGDLLDLYLASDYAKGCAKAGHPRPIYGRRDAKGSWRCRECDRLRKEEKAASLGTL